MPVKLSALPTGRTLPPGRFMVLISVRGFIDPRVIVCLEGLCQLQNPVTRSGIEPVTFWLEFPFCFLMSSVSDIIRYVIQLYRTVRLILDSIHCLVYSHNVLETGSVSVLRWMGQDKPTQMGPSERASLNLIYTR
jgi:hypothetical protein